MTAPNNSSLHKLSEQDIRDIFNKYGMNYSQIVGEETTLVSASLFAYNQAIKEIVATIDRIAIESKETLADEVGKMLEIQGINGTWNYDPYMHGMYNGMEFCHALIKGVEPKYREAPKEWLADKKIDPKLGGGTQASLTNKPKEDKGE